MREPQFTAPGCLADLDPASPHRPGLPDAEGADDRLRLAIIPIGGGRRLRRVRLCSTLSDEPAPLGPPDDPAIRAPLADPRPEGDVPSAVVAGLPHDLHPAPLRR